MDIGKERRTIIVTPAENPVPQEQPKPLRKPVPRKEPSTPSRTPDKEPVKK